MIGTRFGPYQLLDEIGTGAMGKVFSARVVDDVHALSPGATVALKVIHAHLLDSPGLFERFQREAKLGRTIRHPNVVHTHFADVEHHAGFDQHFLVMEYVRGQTLRDLLLELGQVPEELCRHIGREVAKGLQAIHEAGVVHRDLKPANVLITGMHEVKVMDLGLSLLKDEAIRLSQTGAFAGSPQYAAPEQFRPDDGLDGRTDLYALGAVLYELVTGRKPHRGRHAHDVMRRILQEEAPRAGQVNPQVSAFFEEVLHTLLAKRREDRFPDAAVLLRVLEEGEAGTWWQDRSQVLRRETRRPLRRVRIPRETALYGRDEELAALEDAYRRACDGHGQVLLIEGEAGVGKTRLVDEFVAGLVEAGEELDFLFGAYPPGGAATAAGALSTAYREHFGSYGLERTLRQHLPEMPLLVPGFAAVLRGDAMPAKQEHLTKASLQAVFVHTTRALAAERPCVILVDDLHFAPEEGRALFAALALGVPDHRVLLIGTSRPGLPREWIVDLERQEHTTCTRLQRLGAKDLALLLKDTFRSDRLAQQLGLKIAEMSDGNPFFAFEIVQGLRDSEFVTQTEDGSWIGTRTIESLPVPSSVQDLIHARLVDLDERDRELLDVASCCGYEFDGQILAAVLGAELVPTLRRLAQLERRQRLVRSAGKRFVFDHHQVQEGLYASLPALLAREYHAAIGAALAAESDQEPASGERAVQLCHHFLKGGRGEDAQAYLTTALDHLETRYLHGPTVALADLALDAPGFLQGAERVEVLLRRIAGLHLLTLRAEEAASIEEATQVVDDLGRPDLECLVLQARGQFAMAQARFEEARQFFGRRLEVAESHGMKQSMAQAMSGLGSALSRLARHEEAEAVLLRGLALSRELGNRTSEAAAEGSLGLLGLDRGEYEAALEHLRRQHEIARDIGSPIREATAEGGMGILCAEQGKLEDARAHFERKLGISREIGDREGEAVATANLGMVFVSLGRYERARALYEQTLALAREIGAVDGEAHAEGNLGVVCFDLCRYADALAHYQRQIALTREMGDRYLEANALVNLARLNVVLGRLDQARDVLDEGLAHVREVGMARVEGYALHALATVAEEQGDAEEAQRRYGEALAIQRRIGAREAAAETLVARGRLASAQGDVAGAVADLDEGLALSREIDAPGTLYLATVHRARLPGGDVAAVVEALDELERGVGNAVRMQARWALHEATGAIEHAVHARRQLERALANTPVEFHDSMRRDVALHRAILAGPVEPGLTES